MKKRNCRKPIVHCVVTLEGGESVNDYDREELGGKVESLLRDDERLALFYGQFTGFDIIVEVDHQ